MKILAFGASNSKKSINKTLASFTASQIQGENAEVLDLNDYEAAIFSIDREKESGIPSVIVEFYEKIRGSDLIVISLAEHNGSYSAAFKNIIDWTSRHRSDFFKDKKIFLLSTSTGPRGGKSVMETAISRFPRHGAEIIETFSLPSFDQNFDEKKGILSEDLAFEFISKIQKIKESYGLENS
jgi:chromate reductase